MLIATSSVNIDAAKRSGLGQPLHGLLFESLLYSTIMTAALPGCGFDST